MPRCIFCDAHYPLKRAELGYSTCLTCGERDAAQLRTSWCIAPIAHKQGATLVTNRDDLKAINKYANE